MKLDGVRSNLETPQKQLVFREHQSYFSRHSSYLCYTAPDYSVLRKSIREFFEAWFQFFLQLV